MTCGRQWKRGDDGVADDDGGRRVLMEIWAPYCLFFGIRCQEEKSSFMKDQNRKTIGQFIQFYLSFESPFCLELSWEFHFVMSLHFCHSFSLAALSTSVSENFSQLLYCR